MGATVDYLRETDLAEEGRKMLFDTLLLPGIVIMVGVVMMIIGLYQLRPFKRHDSKGEGENQE